MLEPRALFTVLAGDIADSESAFDAEMTLSTMLGTVYGMAGHDRSAVVAAFAKALGQFAAEEGELALQATLGALGHGPDATLPRDGTPAWVSALGKVRCTGTYAYGDVYGDQVSHLATFRYTDSRRGGPEHAVVALVDHNLGFVKDVFVGVPAKKVLTAVREMAADDPDIWFSTVEPALLRGAVTTHLAHTDSLADLPPSESLPSDRAFALARLALLPEPEWPAEPEPLPAKERGALLKSFKASAGAKALTAGSVSVESLTTCAELIVDWADSRDGQPLRWSPAAVDLFLRDWAPRKADLDEAGLAALPAVLDAWIRWAGRRRKLPAAAIAETRAAIHAS